jgi:hypothetical protein
MVDDPYVSRLATLILPLPRRITTSRRKRGGKFSSEH